MSVNGATNVYAWYRVNTNDGVGSAGALLVVDGSGCWFGFLFSVHIELRDTSI